VLWADLSAFPARRQRVGRKLIGGPERRRRYHRSRQFGALHNRATRPGCVSSESGAMNVERSLNNSSHKGPLGDEWLLFDETVTGSVSHGY
jgi:hypothetical protein